jgi:hypothetical protein
VIRFDAATVVTLQVSNEVLQTHAILIRAAKILQDLILRNPEVHHITKDYFCYLFKGDKLTQFLRE